MAKSKVDIMKMDLYGILGVAPEATDKEIVKAYRKKALKCHPDKNPDNPKAADQFHELSNALEVLTDPSAKAAYDNVLRAKKLSDERHRALDSKRKKLKDDLEAREKFSERRQEEDDNRAQRNLMAEILRLRKEGSKLLEQEQVFMREQMKSATNVDDDSDSNDEVESPKIKIRWNSKRAEYTEEDLRALFSRYGEIANILVSIKKKGSAIIEFESYTPLLKLAENELGTNTNPLTVTWLSGKPMPKAPKLPKPAEKLPAPSVPLPTFPCAAAAPLIDSGFDSISTSGGHKDFENLVLMRMRQAEERKRLAEEMQKEDEEEEKK